MDGHDEAQIALWSIQDLGGLTDALVGDGDDNSPAALAVQVAQESFSTSNGSSVLYRA